MGHRYELLYGALTIKNKVKQEFEDCGVDITMNRRSDYGTHVQQYHAGSSHIVQVI